MTKTEKKSNFDLMSSIPQKLIDCIERGNKILICGNGGSAVQSSHFAEELQVKLTKKRIALPAIALSDSAVITAIGNDFGFEYIFSRQIEAIGNEGDLLIVLSTSGKSKNCLKAIETAESLGLEVLEFPRRGKDVADIQDNQLKLMHKVCQVVEDYFYELRRGVLSA